MKYFFLLLILSASLMGNAYFMLQKVEEKQADELAQIEQEVSKIYFTEKLFSQDFELKDYSATRFSLEQEGKDIITNAREFHSSPALIKGDAYDEYVCAGYVFELSRKLWDPSAPYLIGMMEQNTKTVADAWQLPYSYEYVGGSILSDFTGDFSLDEKNYWKAIDTGKLKDFFDTSFSEEALFGDIGFLYKNTEFLQDLKTYQNSNSHITKNIGISEFTRTINLPENKSHNIVFSEALSCDFEVFEQMQDLLKNYEIFIDEQRIVLYENEFYRLGDDALLGEKVIFTDMSELKFYDVTLMHFFEGAHVESLFEMTCQGEFFPINIMQVNPRFIEKM